jgi:hypothetical protein
MTEEIRQEALAQIDLDIKFGFEGEQQLFDGIRDMFYEEEDFDEDWLQEVISQKFQQHRLDSHTWSHPTDFERLVKAFDELISEEMVVCLHNAGHTKSDGEEDCLETIERLGALGVKAKGFCYYHSQDLARAIDPGGTHSLCIRFDSATHDDSEALTVANRIVDKLKKHGFEVVWTGTVDQCIEITKINWQKVPDEQEWGGERVLRILARTQKDKKPFWKFW